MAPKYTLAQFDAILGTAAPSGSTAQGGPAMSGTETLATPGIEAGPATPELQDLINKCGKPYYMDKKEEIVTSVNQRFWAALHHAENTQLYDPAEKVFWRYAYDPETGLYGEISEDIIKQEIAARMLEISRERNLLSLEKKVTNATLNNVASQLKGIAEKRNAFKRDKKHIHVANGVLDFKDDGEVDLCKFSPTYFSRNQSPIKYDPDAKCDRYLNELLRPVLSPEDVELMQKYAGMALSGGNPIQRFLIAHGAEGGQGKSCWVGIIQLLVGLVNATELRTQFLDSRFELFRYLRKSLLIGADVPGNFLCLKGASIIKKLVGGDWLDAEQKGGTGSFQFQGNFPIIITANSRLRVHLDGDTMAWKRRLLIVHYKAIPQGTKKIPRFDELLIKEEGSGILNWAIDGYRRVLADINAYGDIYMTEAQRGAVDALLAESDSLRHFLINSVVISENGSLLTEEILRAYAEYCPKMGWNPKPITELHRELEGLMLELFGTTRANSIEKFSGKGRGYRRVSLKLEAEGQEP